LAEILPLDEALQPALALLAAGEVVALPTETVYGLAGDATNGEAVARIFEVKGRPRFNPLIVHVSSLDMARKIGVFDDASLKLAETFWPGPLTLVLKRRPGSGLSDIVSAGLDTVGVRIPAHPLARALIRAAGVPVAAPSANPSGRLSPTTAAQVTAAFRGRVPVLDGGPCRAGVESTILAVDGERVVQLRAGALARDEIEKAIGRPVERAAAGAAIASPGMMASHYAPNASLRLDAEAPEPGEAYLAFGDRPGTLNLSPTGDLREAARNLFAMLHALDAKAARIAVAPIPAHGLGEAINDRLRRAAVPRAFPGKA
jgi:L-threonylcarbamoyladenylate synthase